MSFAEAALDSCMRDAGGFEGNAQTLRILCKLEKRQTKQIKNDEPLTVNNGRDERVGLNLTFRTLAAVLKYDQQIPRQGKERSGDKSKLVKGYYYTEADVVRQIKKHIGATKTRNFKTIECSIMDLADDIAYSTYDLEDSFKAGFLSPLSMFAAQNETIDEVAARVSERLRREYPSIKPAEVKLEVGHVYQVLMGMFSDLFRNFDGEFKRVADGKLDTVSAAGIISSLATIQSNMTAAAGYYRTKLTSELVGSFVRAVQVDARQNNPALSRAYLDIETFKRVEVLKNFAYQSLIMSPMLKVAEHRGKEIVTRIFNALNQDEGHLLMPEDCKAIYTGLSEPDEKRRVICDFIACMTDRYAIQFYNRLFGTTAESIYSPL